MKLHIFTLNWNGGDKLLKLYNSLVPNVIGFDAVWHIRDNGSKDNSLKDVLEAQKDTLLVNDYSIGHNRDTFARGMNYLYEQATPSDDDLILLLNNDVLFNDSDSINKMYKVLSDEISVVGARLLYTDTNRLQHGGVIFSTRYNKLPYHYRHGEESDDVSKKNRYFQVVTAAVSLIKAQAFNKVNGFDENFKWAFDDVDLNLRIGRDKKIAYCGETNIYHEESASLRKNSLNKLFMNNNVKTFRDKWTDKYEIDHEKYLKDVHYNEIRPATI